MRETSARVSGELAGRDMRPTITATLTRSRTVPTASTRGARGAARSVNNISSGSVTLAYGSNAGIVRPPPARADPKSSDEYDPGPTVGIDSIGPGGGCDESALGDPLARRRGITFSTNCSRVTASACCSATWRNALSASAISRAVA